MTGLLVTRNVAFLDRNAALFITVFVMASLPKIGCAASAKNGPCGRAMKHAVVEGRSRFEHEQVAAGRYTPARTRWFFLMVLEVENSKRADKERSSRSSITCAGFG
jgi:hypothetical protein